MNLKNTRATLFLVFLFTISLAAQKAEERSVQLSSFHDESSNELVLEWKASPNATLYSLSEWKDGRWMAVASLGDTVLQYRIPDYDPGIKREFRILKFGGLQGYGYIQVGRELPVVGGRGSCLLVVDSVLSVPLEAEISTWIEDAESDGWKVKTLIVNQQMSPQALKVMINEWNGRITGGQATVFFLGHVPVAYSGLIAPDGHTDHNGAWPSDAYYADMDGNWTDISVNNTSANDPRNKNVPGDGKFDQSTIPSDLELQIGRVDFFNMPAFPDDYIELTRNYLKKNHAFKMADFQPKRRGLIENNFASFDEGFAQNGWKNFAVTVGRDSIDKVDYETTLETEDYLWAYACGGGSYTSMGGVGNTNSLYVQRQLKAVFVMNFGSYFGDWDKANNLLRASLASGTILTNAWAGRPNWQFHPMALGETIGQCARISQNNSNQYSPGFGARSIHVALLGDPTLRLHSVIPPVYTKSEEIDGKVELAWQSMDTDVTAYMIYRREEGQDEFVELGDMIVDTFYLDSAVHAQRSYEYMVKSVKLEQTPSGSYYNTSLGARTGVQTIQGCLPTAAFSHVLNYDRVELSNLSLQGVDFLWEFSDGAASTEENPSHLFQAPGSYEICLTVTNECGEDRVCQDITAISSLPDSLWFEISDVLCFGDSTGAIALIHSGTVTELSYEWNTGGQDSVLANLKAGQYDVIIISGTGKEVNRTIEVGEASQIIADIATTPSSGQDGTATANVMGGTPPYRLTWGDGTIDPQMLPPGDYVLTVRDSNDCEVDFPFKIEMTTSIWDNYEIIEAVFPNPASDRVILRFHEIGQEIFEVNWTDLLGKSGKAIFKYSSEYLEIDVSEFTEGFYSLTVLSVDGSRFVVGVVVSR